ncbi:MAG: hypothetical protein K9M57_01295 [Phycisphaerae bacterium]|nr:hypothetical protein [Phycisphaerae bacterium]
MKKQLTTSLIAIIAILATLALSPGTCQAKLSQDQLHELAYDARALFRQATEERDDDKAQELYRQTILHYQKIIDEGGVVNEYLYYNIANTYLLMDDIGRAILNYKRAERFGSLNPELTQNLNFARSRRIDQVPVKTQKQVLKTLFFWHYDFSQRTRFILAGIFWALACLTACIKLWSRRPGRGLVWTAIISLLIALILATSVGMDEYRSHKYKQGVIIAPEVIGRYADRANADKSFKEPLHSGTEFDLLEKRTHWLHIELSNGDQTWIPDESAGII